jgi:hypothetical protein
MEVSLHLLLPKTNRAPSDLLEAELVLAHDASQYSAAILYASNGTRMSTMVCSFFGDACVVGAARGWQIAHPRDGLLVGGSGLGAVGPVVCAEVFIVV